MPELPEIQSFVTSLNQNYVGKKIKHILFHRDSLRYPFDQVKLKKIFHSGAQLKNCFRIGKQLILETEAGAVHISLGMSGAFKPTRPHHPEKHEHVTLVFQGEEALGYIDPRRFGFWLTREDSTLFSAVDPLSASALMLFFTTHKAAKSTRSVKAVLMDQKLIGGVGNIYALEALFASGVHPERICSQIKNKEWEKLAHALPKILTRAIAAGGSSISSYRTLDGSKGHFQNAHHVYGREGEKCIHKSCTALIVRITQNGRSSWFCPHCQKL